MYITFQKWLSVRDILWMRGQDLRAKRSSNLRLVYTKRRTQTRPRFRRRPSDPLVLPSGTDEPHPPVVVRVRPYITLHYITARCSPHLSDPTLPCSVGTRARCRRRSSHTLHHHQVLTRGQSHIPRRHSKAARLHHGSEPHVHWRRRRVVDGHVPN